MPASPITVIPAPPDMEADQYIHRLSGALVVSRIVGFRVSDSGAEPIAFPALTGDQWEKIIDLGNGYVSAFGRQARNATDLSNAIRVGRPQ